MAPPQEPAATQRAAPKPPPHFPSPMPLPEDHKDRVINHVRRCQHGYRQNRQAKHTSDKAALQTRFQGLVREMAAQFRGEEAQLEQIFHADISGSWLTQGIHVAEVEADFAKDPAAALTKWSGPNKEATLQFEGLQGTRGQGMVGAGQQGAPEMRGASDSTRPTTATSSMIWEAPTRGPSLRPILPKPPHGLPSPAPPQSSVSGYQSGNSAPTAARNTRSVEESQGNRLEPLLQVFRAFETSLVDSSNVEENGGSRTQVNSLPQEPRVLERPRVNGAAPSRGEDHHATAPNNTAPPQKSGVPQGAAGRKRKIAVIDLCD